MTQWMKTIAGSMCILTVLLHLVPDGQFGKYVRFYAGLVFFLIVLHPVLELLGSEEKLEQMLRLEFLKEDFYEMKMAEEGLSEMKNEQIVQAYQAELSRQITEIAAAYGLTLQSVQIQFGEDGYSVDAISMTVKDFSGEDENSAIEDAKSEITGLYLIEESEIDIRRLEQ